MNISAISRWSAPLLLLALVSAPLAAAEPADQVFFNGKVFTADRVASVEQAFAIRGDRFVAVGSYAAMRPFIGPKTKRMDLRGRLVTPGLADNHFHGEGGGPGVDLSRARTMSQLLAAVAKAAAAAPADAIVVSNADWHEAQLMEKRLPTAQELAQASPYKPVVLVRGGHSYILSTAALERFKISKQTVAPPGGSLPKDSNGELTGELIDAAKSLVKLPSARTMSMADILATQKAVNPYGITAVKIPGGYMKGDTVAAYRMMRQAAAAGELTLRYTIYLPGIGFDSVEKARATIAKWGLQQDEGDDWVRIGGIKLGVDGGFEGGHMFRPYEEPFGQGGKYFGIQTVSQQDFTDVVRELNRLGWRPTTHAVGDAAVEQVLHAYEAANADSPVTGKRWSIEHAFVVTSDQIPRLKALGVTASVQDHLYLAAPMLEKYWGSQRASHVTPVRSYVDAGLLVTGGTDSPVVPFNPFWALYHFMTRDTINDGIYGNSERLRSRSELLELVTINFARSIGEEDRKGSIEPGKLADFAVLTQDFLTVPAERMRDIKSVATYVSGRQVYRDPAF